MDAQELAADVVDAGQQLGEVAGRVVRRLIVIDDLTQEVFCRAWQAWDRYRDALGPMLAGEYDEDPFVYCESSLP